MGETVVVGFNRSALAAALGVPLGGEGAPRAEVLLARYEQVLGALTRAARQLPDARLDWRSPERDRTLRQFLYHVYDRPALVLRGLATGLYRYEDVEQAYRDAEAFRTSADLLAAGERMQREVRRFLERATPADLAQPIESYQGRLTVGDLLTLALGHAAHHLRQLYHYMGLLGIGPEAPLGDRDFEGIPLPSSLF